MTTRKQYLANVDGTTRHDATYHLSIIGRNHDKPDDDSDVSLQIWSGALNTSINLAPDRARELARHLLACADANEPLPVAIPLTIVSSAPASLYAEPEAA